MNIIQHITDTIWLGATHSMSGEATRVPAEKSAPVAVANVVDLSGVDNVINDLRFNRVQLNSDTRYTIEQGLKLYFNAPASIMGEGDSISVMVGKHSGMLDINAGEGETAIYFNGTLILTASDLVKAVEAN